VITARHLTDIHQRAALAYGKGIRDVAALAGADDREYLAGVGISPQVLFDYVEDFIRYGAPDAAAFVGVAELRSEYFRDTLKSVAALKVVPESALPLREEAWDGIPWLPRIAAKARCFLEGTLCTEVMYGCSGDRSFLAKFGLTLPGFLAAVKTLGDDPAKILEFVREK